jgi:hypothetical protein
LIVSRYADPQLQRCPVVVIVPATTVGYGDKCLVAADGRGAAVVLMLVGIG